MTDATSPLTSAVSLPFETRVTQLGCWPLCALTPTTLQVNLGYRCNQRCAHCHVGAGPERTEAMTRATMDAVIDAAAQAGITDVDLTGGAPELHPDFRWFVETLTRGGAQVTDRCNLTVLLEEGQEELPAFLAAQRVRVMASLPHYNADLTDRVRGQQVFARSLQALRRLNAAGYGQPGSPCELVLVYNPAGAVLPASQQELEREFRAQLHAQHGIAFTRLVALTNIPTGRFLAFLQQRGNLARYMARLERQFNPATLPHLMCRSLLSVGWDGTLYDCDFNQALGIAIRNGTTAQIQHTPIATLAGRTIRCRDHCYGCTAGQGSSCGGVISN